MAKNEQKDDEDYWNSSEKHSFSFDQTNEIDNVFGISKSGTAQLRAGISNIDITETFLSFDSTLSSFKPLLSIISESTLSAILGADKVYLFDEQSTPDPNITIKRILLDQPFSLEKYKSFNSKISLLDAAIASGNGNAILIVILFITKTLKSSLVHRILIERVVAMNVYIHYLAIRMQINEITDLLMMQERSLDATLIHLNIILKNTKDETRLLQKLQKCYKTQFINLPDCKETPFIKNYLKLLEWKAALKTTNKFDEEFEKNSAVLDCLKYICEHHWKESENSLTSPLLLTHQHDISSRQYQKVALETRISVQAWEDIDTILLSKGWLGNHKLQSSLPVEDILKILHKGQSPTIILDKFLKYVDNLEKRLKLAKHFKCARTVIEILGTQGDRTSLLEYRDTLIPQSEFYFLAEKTLSSPAIRWKS